jgi:hypothetical protein
VVRKVATFFLHMACAVRRRTYTNTNGFKGWPNQQYHVAVYRQGRYDAARGDRCGGRGCRGCYLPTRMCPQPPKNHKKKREETGIIIKKTAGMVLART